MLFFTICCNNYLAQAVTLGKSLQQFNPSVGFKIGLVDRLHESIDYSTIPFELVRSEQIGIEGFNDICLKYSVTELNTAVKPFYFNHFLSKIPDGECVIYLDPDIMIFNSFGYLINELKNRNIVITPHFTNPIEDDLRQNEEDFLNSGLYNLGFIAIKNTIESGKMVKWWSERLRHKAYIDLEKGMFTDQIWINFVPLFFKDVSILRDPGYNVAYWNLHERHLDGHFVLTTEGVKHSLVFFHFSGFDPGKPDILSKYQTRFSFENRPDIHELFKLYRNELYNNGYSFYSGIPCWYAVKREKYRNKILAEKINSIPFYKRAIRKIILRIAASMNIMLDYSQLNSFK